MAKSYRLTAARKRALHRAQLISARKRKGKGRGKKKLSTRSKVAIGVGVLGTAGAATTALAGTAAYTRHKWSGSTIQTFAKSPTPTAKAFDIETRKMVDRPVTKPGLRIYTFDTHSAVSYMSRHKGQDQLSLYIHRPLRKTRLRAGIRIIKADILGRKIRGAPKGVVGKTPPQAKPDPTTLSPFDDYPESREMYQWANKLALTSDARARRRANMHRRNNGRPQKFGIDGQERNRRFNKYRNGMRKKGITISDAHMSRIMREFLKEKE